MKQPKGLKLFDRAHDLSTDLRLELADNVAVEGDFPACCAVSVADNATILDADQLDKLAERCKAFAKYLRSLPKTVTKKPKWEDV